MTDMMQAWQLSSLGEPADVLELVDITTPTAGAGKLLVKVRSTALQFPDVMMCRGDYQIRPELPFTPGVELCGEVVALGDGVSRFAVGDRIIGTPDLPYGGLAEYALLNADEALPAPEALGDDAAAAMNIAYQTAWFCLHRRTRIQAGQTLVVHAAAGGVGSAAVQLGKAAGARVIGVVGGPDKAAAATSLGADVVIDRREVDLVEALKDATGRQGADVVVDPVGGTAYEASTKCVAFEGTIVVVGFASGTVPAPMLAHSLIKNYTIAGLHWGLYRQRDPAEVARVYDKLTALAADGVVNPLIGERLPRVEAPGGLTRIAAGDTIGRVIVKGQ